MTANGESGERDDINRRHTIRMQRKKAVVGAYSGRGALIASYLHACFPSNPAAVAALLTGSA